MLTWNFISVSTFNSNSNPIPGTKKVHLFWSDWIQFSKLHFCLFLPISQQQINDKKKILISETLAWNSKFVSTFNSNSNAISATKKTWSLSSESATPRFYSEYYMSRYMSLDSWCVYTCVWYTLRSYRIGPFSIL